MIELDTFLNYFFLYLDQFVYKTREKSLFGYEANTIVKNQDQKPLYL